MIIQSPWHVYEYKKQFNDWQKVNDEDVAIFLPI